MEKANIYIDGKLIGVSTSVDIGSVIGDFEELMFRFAKEKGTMPTVAVMHPATWSKIFTQSNRTTLTHYSYNSCYPSGEIRYGPVRVFRSFDVHEDGFVIM